MNKYVLAVLLVLPFQVIADQVVIPDYDTARDRFFYREVYPDGGNTLYCDAAFTNRKGLNVEHVYPASWMKETAGCPASYSRKRCRAESDRFNRMEADLHNLYPALADVNQDRSNYLFAILGTDDEDQVYSHPRVPAGCDFEFDADLGQAEPRRAVRGEIARAIFYMHQEYGAPIDPEMGQLLIAWHRSDAPSDEERARNDRIEALQGTRNPFIDGPALADSLVIGSQGANGGESPQCLIKGNVSRSGKIFHTPGSRHYDAVKINTDKGERWFCSLDEAIQAGWRAPY